MTVTNTGFDVRLERTLDASPEEAFDAWVDPAARLHWYAPDPGWEVEAGSDLRVGGKWWASFGPAGKDKWTEDGEYREVDRPHRLVYTSKFTHTDGRFFWTLVTVTFTAVEGGAYFVLEDCGFPDEAERAAHEGGWPSFLDAYERFLARG